MTTAVLGASAPSSEPADPTDLPPARGWQQSALGYFLLALLSYVPPLLTQPGKVVADTKSYLYLDPDRMLGRAASMWDPNIGMGTVTHQNIGYLFPMGPFYWSFQHLGVPDWVAERIWLGTLVFMAGAGVLYLGRTLALRGPGIVVSALAYAFSPYSLHYASRISVILLPWAGLGWALGFTIKALRDGGWRYPALFAIWVQVVGGVNATVLIFAGVAPVAWILYSTFITREVHWRRALGTTLKIGSLSLVTSLWWISGLSIQGAYGLDILKYTETLQAVARTSAPNEVLRGLGYWFFYGTDRLGPWIEAARNYTQRPAIILLGYGIACLALLSAAVVRWRHRVFFVILTLIGVVIAVGAHPYDSPTPLGGVFKAFANSSAAGLALRSTGRAIPLVVLGLAMLLGSAIDAASIAAARAARTARDARAARSGRPAYARVKPQFYGIAIAVVVGGLVLANFPALYDGTYYGKNLERPENVPQYWQDAANWQNQQSYATRVLELPGADFASYRWGNTVDPITPGLMDRPYVARELIPYGTAGTADLLNAFDRRIQEGVSDPSGYADVLRRMGVGDVMLRYDIQYERYNLIRPTMLNQLFTPVPAGMTKGPTFGTKAAGSPPAKFQDELDLAAPPNQKTPPPVVDYRVKNPTPIVHAESTARPLVIAGSGEGMIDASDAGLLAGAGTVVYSASYDQDPAQLRSILGTDGVLVVTDSNRRQARRWSTVRENLGYTEQRGEKPYVADPSDARLPVFPNENERAYTVTDQRGLKRVVASVYGNPISYTPEDRASQALDGNLDTAWKAQAFNEAIGTKFEIDTRQPITTDRVNLVQPLKGPRDRFITEVKLTFDGKHSLTERLGSPSRTATGQTILFPRRTFSKLTITVTNDNTGKRLLNSGASAIGFAEIRLRDEHAAHDLRVDEVIDMPRDLLSMVGTKSASHPLVILMNRDRTLPVPPRLDPERNLARDFVLPTARTFSLTGDARVTTDVDTSVLDADLGLPAPSKGGIATETSEYMSGCVHCRPDDAIDGDPTTAYNTPFTGVRSQWVQYTLPRPVTFDHMNLQVVADGRHSVPTKLRIDVDNASQEVTVPAVKDRNGDQNATVTVPLTFPAMTGRRIRVTIEDVRPVNTYNFFSTQPLLMPVGIAELGIPGVQLAPAPAQLPASCRSDLMTIDGKPFPVKIVGSDATAQSLGALTVVPCDPANPKKAPTIHLAAGEHVLRTTPGQQTGIELDRLVLASDAGGAPLASAGGRVTALPDKAPPAPEVTVGKGRTKMHVQVRGASAPFWLVLGESNSPGWHATIKGSGSLGTPQLVDGYANGWRIDPKGRSVLDITVEWTPQRRVWAALGLSSLAVLAALLIIVVSYVRRRSRARSVAPLPGEGDTTLAWPFAPYGSGRGRWAIVAPAVAGVLAGAIVSPPIGLLTFVLVVLALRFPRARVVLSLAPPILLGLAAVYIAAKQQRYQLPPVFEWPTLFPRAETPAWLAVILFSADAWVEVVRSPRRPMGSAPIGRPVNPSAEHAENEFAT